MISEWTRLENIGDNYKVETRDKIINVLHTGDKIHLCTDKAEPNFSYTLQVKYYKEIKKIIPNVKAIGSNASDFTIFLEKERNQPALLIAEIETLRFKIDKAIEEIVNRDDVNSYEDYTGLKELEESLNELLKIQLILIGLLFD